MRIADHRRGSGSDFGEEAGEGAWPSLEGLFLRSAQKEAWQGADTDGEFRLQEGVSVKYVDPGVPVDEECDAGGCAHGGASHDPRKPVKGGPRRGTGLARLEWRQTLHPRATIAVH